MRNVRVKRITSFVNLSNRRVDRTVKGSGNRREIAEG